MLKQRSWPTSWPRTLGGALPASLQRAARSPPGRQQGRALLAAGSSHTSTPNLVFNYKSETLRRRPPSMRVVSASLINPLPRLR